MSQKPKGLYEYGREITQGLCLLKDIDVNVFHVYYRKTMNRTVKSQDLLDVNEYDHRLQNKYDSHSEVVHLSRTKKKKEVIK